MGGSGQRKRHIDDVSGGRKDGKPKKKGKKRGKVMKDLGSTVDHQVSILSSLDKTANEEGKTMSQVMSTFSRFEQSRFEAFRRATLPSDVVSKFTAHCLIHEQHRPLSAGVHVSTDHERISQKNNPTRPAVLSEVVAPGQESEITMIVSTLAKTYAQRLLTAARQFGIERIQKASRSSGNTAPIMTDGIVPVTSNDILQVLEERRVNGLDPGFFLQPASTSRQKPTIRNDPQSGQKLLAALQVQEEYDKIYGVPMDTDDSGNDDNTSDDGDVGADWGDVVEEEVSQNEIVSEKSNDEAGMEESRPMEDIS